MDTPLLIIGFNRPDYIHKLFDVISLVKPSKIYFSVDGPRVNNSMDQINCALVKDVLNRIDWVCTLETNYSTKNLGCKLAVTRAIDWFFSKEEYGIILEDDCIPNLSFFDFCETMLIKYKLDSRIGMITGTNYMIKSNDNNEYFFSKHYIIWGWATWRRCWADYDLNLAKYKLNKEKLDIEFIKNSRKWYHWYYHKFLFELIINNKIDTWDIQWVNLCIYNNYLCVTPPYNLVSNIGVTGTHADKNTDSHFLETIEFDIKDIRSPISFLSDSQYDNFLFKEKYIKTSIRSLLRKSINNLKFKI